MSHDNSTEMSTSAYFKTLQTTAAAVVWLREELQCTLIAAEVSAELTHFSFLSAEQIIQLAHSQSQNSQFCRFDLVGVSRGPEGHRVHIVEVKGTSGDYTREHPFDVNLSAQMTRRRSSHRKWEDTAFLQDRITFWVFHGPFMIHESKSPPLHWRVVANRGTYESPKPIISDARTSYPVAPNDLVAESAVPLGQKSIESVVRKNYVKGKIIEVNGEPDRYEPFSLQDLYVVNTAALVNAFQTKGLLHGKF